MKVFETTVWVVGISLDVVEEVTFVGLGKEVETASFHLRPEHEVGFASSPPSNLETRLRPEAAPSLRGHPRNAGFGLGKIRHRVDTGGTQLVALHARDVRHQSETIGLLPHFLAVRFPSAQCTCGHRFGIGGWPVIEELLQFHARPPCIGGHLVEPDRESGPVTEFEMRVFGGSALHVGEHVAVEAQLQHVLGIRSALELGIDYLVGPVSQGRWDVDLFQEIRIASPCSVQHRTLEDHVCAGAHRRHGGRHALFDGSAGNRDLDDVPAVALEPIEETQFVRVALRLE